MFCVMGNNDRAVLNCKLQIKLISKYIQKMYVRVDFFVVGDEVLIL